MKNYLLIMIALGIFMIAVTGCSTKTNKPKEKTPAQIEQKEYHEQDFQVEQEPETDFPIEEKKEDRDY